MKLSYSISILCEPQTVFPWIAEPKKAMLWQTGVNEEVIIEEKLNMIGTTFKEKMEEDGNSLEIIGEITRYINNKLIAFHLKSKIHELDVVYSIEYFKNVSMLSIESNINWKFPVSIISIFIGRKIKDKIMKQTEMEFAKLKELCEKNDSEI